MPDTSARAPRVQYIATEAGLDEIEFTDGLAAVEIPFALLDRVPLSNEVRQPGPRLRRLKRAIRNEGFRPVDPIICRVGMKGRWVVVDGGHRITAAREVGRECWANLFGPKVRTLYFLLFTTSGSWSKLREAACTAKAGADLPVSPLPEVPPVSDED